MPNQQPDLTDVFRALGDPTRMAVVETLARGRASASELARPFHMALPSFTQHLGILEDCGLVTSQKLGRVRTYQLQPQKLRRCQPLAGRRNADMWKSALINSTQFFLATKDKHHDRFSS